MNMDTEDKIGERQLLTEFATWAEHKGHVIKLLQHSICDDGRVCLELSIGTDKRFSLLCPAEYPHYEDHFFVEATACLQFWCNALNEFILDSTVLLSLEAILDKAASLYYNKKATRSPCASSSESELEGEEFMVVDGDSEDGEEWEHVLCQKKKRWRLKEAELRAATKQPKTSDMFDGNIKDHPKQVFSNSAASGILTNDLVAIMESKHKTGISAEPIEDNIYKWAVFLSAFDTAGQLDGELRQLKQLYGYDYVELQLDFTMDLYPFYPPVVKVVRPRLQGSMMLRVAGMDVLKLSHWNPARDMRSVLQEIKDYLGTWARLDLDSERNDIRRFPQGAYIDMENYLLWLAWVSEIPSRAHRRFPQTERDAPALTAPDNDKKKLHEKSLFPAGTGYSSSFHKGWDINAYLAAQREKDKQIECVLQKILQELRKGSHSDLDLKHDTYSSFMLPSCSSKKPYTANWGQQNGKSPVDPTEDLYNVLEASTLVPFLESKLQVDSFLEICQHTAVYRCVVDIISEIASRPKLVGLLWSLPDQVQSIYTLVSRLEDKAKAILVQLTKTSANGNIPAGKKKNNSGSAPDAPEEEKLARDFYQMSHAVSAALGNQGFLATSESPSTSQSQQQQQQQQQPLSPMATSNDQALAQTYKDALKDLQFLSCDIEVEGASAHHYSTHFKKALPPNSAQVIRIAQEMAALSTSLPLDLGSAIFIRTDDAKCTLLRALIIGPEGTPYSGGCFQFDIFFPPQYPTQPPLVHFCTTGLGQVRFNPNLYACGMVCLSLLGTWKGLQGEHWHETSTLLQVLISIQSLILVPEPYFNEPGYEALLGTDKGRRYSQSYSEDILVNTIMHAMVSQLRRPSSGFEDVVRTHFRIKRKRILKEIKGHMKSYNNTKALQKAYESLRVELDKLKDETAAAKDPM
ncbi:baculoviral IAP repeat-containing protein 6-like [Periplaneta americana]|uniref:baculoviral IAP repeat-containing protein 6-like n=1 Tax=Periplaneta americana TaxID=6978 RepID=UPI0037E94FB3